MPTHSIGSGKVRNLTAENDFATRPEIRMILNAVILPAVFLLLCGFGFGSSFRLDLCNRLFVTAALGFLCGG